jgi:hypothetical protein
MSELLRRVESISRNSNAVLLLPISTNMCIGTILMDVLQVDPGVLSVPGSLGDTSSIWPEMAGWDWLTDVSPITVSGLGEETGELPPCFLWERRFPGGGFTRQNDNFA